MLPKSLPARIAFLSSLVGGTCVLISALVFGYLQKKQLERQVVEEGIHYAERFTTWTLGYFYQQDNLLHLETQQRFLAQSPNIVYSYIVKSTGEIDVGIDGINSPEVGRKKQEWETQLEFRSDNQNSVSFEASRSLVAKFPSKVRLGDLVLLVGFPVSCPEKSAPCAQLRVALVPETARALASRLTATLGGFGFFAALLTGVAVFFAAKKQFFPLKRITELMEHAQRGGHSEIIRVRSNLSLSQKNESLEIESLRKSLLVYLDTLELSSAHAAVARSTQALAHDVRKPFSMFKAIIHLVENTSDADAVRELLKATLPEVNQAMASVEGMIQDVMQVGSDSRPVLENASPEELLESSLGELFRIYPETDIEVTYGFFHTHKVKVDTLRVGRVFSNVLGNALQAMGKRGKIWIETREQNGLMEFVLGNSGSYIVPENLPRLFDAFFTSEKKGGTGLGLAISKKIIESHGGIIKVRSDKNAQFPNGFVEFVFTLPLAEEQVGNLEHCLPKNSSEVQNSFGTLSAEKALERELVHIYNERSSERKARFTLMVVDDEAVYRNSLRSQIESNSEIAKCVEIVLAENEKTARELVKKKSPDLLIQDVDLGPQSVSGIELIRSLRQSGFVGQICVHSNRFLFEDSQNALAAGANLILPKPMGRAHLLKMILASLNEQLTANKTDLGQSTQELSPAITSAAAAISELPSLALPSIAYVDDSFSFLISMRHALKEHANIHTFRTSQAFLEKLESAPGFKESLSFVITDYYFDTNDPHNGVSLAQELRRQGFVRPILLATGADFLESELDPALDGSIGKELPSWESLKPWLTFSSRES